MRKVKYYYDTETLSYRKIERKKGKTFGLTLLFILGTLVASILLLIVYLNIPGIETPKEKAYKRELDQMTFQYEMMNREMEQITGVVKELEERDNKIYRVYFEADPISEEQRKSGFGGVNRYKNLEGYSNSEVIIETKKRLDQLKKRVVVQSKSLDEIVEYALNKEEQLASIPAIQPVQNKDLKRMASGYGMRIDPIYKTRKMHTGMDFSAPKGTAVFATGNARVKSVKRSRRGYGNHIVLDHGFNYETLYGHLSEIKVYRGQTVKRGDIIGYVGNTGKSTAPHLHYEVLKNGRHVNPIYHYFNDLTPEQFEAMINNSALENQSLD
ncbi:M23 family metallopeptidase [Flavobacteriaceae bacterium 14752]|uniref:M23 family metallopeptidase n=1 Tax=Mesohalobacter salilacus TaxID=2491711 RepID=UPI000F64210E|nr:M23 family metallopeptidase [Flavobacteriaceae bacterium 14752]